MVGGEGMKILGIIVGKVSHLGKRKEKQILLNKQENGLEPLKINFFFFISCPIFSYKIRFR